MSENRVVGSFNSDHHNWTSCQMYGHLFREPDGTPTTACIDCGEHSIDPNEEGLVMTTTTQPEIHGQRPRDEQGRALCAGGCGLPAEIADRTSAKDGLHKGDPKKFAKGHRDPNVCRAATAAIPEERRTQARALRAAGVALSEIKARFGLDYNSTWVEDIPGPTANGNGRSKPRSSRTQVAPNAEAPAERLRSGELRQLVASFIAQRPGEQLSPSKIAKELDRSAGAVANALEVLASQGLVTQTSGKPRTYASANGR